MNTINVFVITIENRNKKGKIILLNNGAFPTTDLNDAIRFSDVQSALNWIEGNKRLISSFETFGFDSSTVSIQMITTVQKVDLSYLRKDKKYKEVQKVYEKECSFYFKGSIGSYIIVEEFKDGTISIRTSYDEYIARYINKSKLEDIINKLENGYYV